MIRRLNVEVSTRVTGSDGPRGLRRPGERGIANTDERGVAGHIQGGGVLCLDQVEGVEELSLKRRLSNGMMARTDEITDLAEEIVDTIERDFGLDDHRDVIESHPRLVSQHIKNCRDGSVR